MILTCPNCRKRIAVAAAKLRATTQLSCVECDQPIPIDPEFLRAVKWILGELHGQRDLALVALLEEHFDISIDKPVGRRLLRFHAIRRAGSPASQAGLRSGKSR